VQRRKTGWWISPSKRAAEKPQWTGPFATIETACLSQPLTRLLCLMWPRRLTTPTVLYSPVHG
jgi:hypothetical protein